MACEGEAGQGAEPGKDVLAVSRAAGRRADGRARSPCDPDATIAAGQAVPGAANLPRPASSTVKAERCHAAVVAAREVAITRLENDMRERAEDARVLRLSAAHRRATSDEKGATDYEHYSDDAERAKAAAETNRRNVIDVNQRCDDRSNPPCLRGLLGAGMVLTRTPEGGSALAIALWQNRIRRSAPERHQRS